MRGISIRYYDWTEAKTNFLESEKIKIEIMDRLLRLGGAGMGMGQNSAPTDAPVVDTAEQVYISSLALLKMLKHGRAGN